MANDKVAIWNGGLKFGRAPAANELLVGNGSGFDQTPSGVTFNPDGSISVAGVVDSTVGGFKFPDDTVQTTAATSYVPATVADQTIISNISGASAAPSANTLTAVLDDIIGSTQGTVIYRGASAWSGLAPGAAGQALMSQGAGADIAWATGVWKTKVKTVTQQFTSNTTLANDPYLFFPMLAGEKFLFRFNYGLKYIGAGGAKMSISSPGTPAAFMVSSNNLQMLTSDANTPIISFAGTGTTPLIVGFQFYGYVENGATAGDLVMQLSQGGSNATATQFLAGSFLEYMEIA